MADATTYVAKYTAANAPLNEKGDLSGWAILMTEDCTFGEFGTNRAEIIKALQQNLDQGWVAHHPIAATAAGEFLAGVCATLFGPPAREIRYLAPSDEMGQAMRAAREALPAVRARFLADDLPPRARLMVKHEISVTGRADHRRAGWAKAGLFRRSS